jgi:nicotinate-nucleotide pyrophosphorylase (carboxylating)
MGVHVIVPPRGYIDKLLAEALEEDLGKPGDITSTAIFGKSDLARAEIRSKESGILSGTYLLEPLYTKIDHAVTVECLCADGDRLAAQSLIARISGPIRAILAGERIALNFLQRLSGVATATSALVSAVSHTRATVLDTRKTTPTLRLLEKKAVVDGGGANHRFGLYDMFLIKDTHVKAAGGVAAAIAKARTATSRRPGMKIEAEVQSVAEFTDALSQMPDRIMLDNMSVSDMKRCVDRVRSDNLPVELEASGNVTQETIVPIAQTGVDFISVGAITHSARALDIHLVIT